MGGWRFDLSERATLTSGEEGEVIGRAEYAVAERSYLLRYTAADGRLVEQWWSESAFA